MGEETCLGGRFGRGADNTMSRGRGVSLQPRKAASNSPRADHSQHNGDEKRYVVDSIEIESHDLELLYNTIVRDDKIRREKDRKCYGYSGATLSKNIITVLIGLITAMVAFGISVCVVRRPCLLLSGILIKSVLLLGMR